MTVTTVTGAPDAVTVPVTTPRTMKMLPDGNSVAQPTTSSNDVATATLRMEARRDRGVRHKKGAPGSLGAEEGTLLERLTHETHVSGEVGDRPDATLLAEPDAARVPANRQRLGQLARIEVEDLHHPRTRNGHISLPVVRRHADAECLARERDRCRLLSGLQVDLTQVTRPVRDVEAVPLAGHGHVLRHAAHGEGAEHYTREHVDLRDGAAAGGTHVDDPPIGMHGEGVRRKADLHAPDDLQRLRVHDVHGGAAG